jgi:hypothetical protein
MAVGALGVLALGTAALLDLGPFAAPEPPRGLEVVDRLEDCRDARLDTGEACDSGADIEAISLWLPEGGALMVELQLTEAPEVGPGSAWTAEFYVEAANAFTGGGVICRLTNVVDGGQPVSEARSYALDPNTVPRESVDDGACEGRLDGSTARFSIDVAGQPDEEPFRLIGLVRIEYPGDSDRLGSEDDFLVRATLADLRD